MDYFDTFRPPHKTWGFFTLFDKVASIVAHLAVPVGVVSGYGVAPIIGPLLVALTIGEISRSVEEEAIEALNFGITMSLLLAIAGLVDVLDAHMHWGSPAALLLRAITFGIAAVSAYRACQRIGDHERRYVHGLHLIRSNATWVPKSQWPARPERDRQLLRLSRVRFVGRRLDRRRFRSQSTIG